MKNMEIAVLTVQNAMKNIASLVIGSGVRISDIKNQALKENDNTCQAIAALYTLNILLAFCLAVSLVALFLAHDTRYVSTSLKVTLTAAVTAIVTSWLLSIGKRLWGGMGILSHRKQFSNRPNMMLVVQFESKRTSSAKSHT